MREIARNFVSDVVEFDVRSEIAAEASARGLRTIKLGFARMFVSGKVVAGGRDHKLVAELNSATSGYKGFVKADGDDGSGEWETKGIYLGRNAWRLDASFHCDASIGVNETGKRIMVSSLTSFSASDNRLIGFQSAGVLLTSSPLDRIRVRSLTKTAVDGFATLLLFFRQ